MGTRNSKAQKLTQNDYRVLHLCINSMQDESTPGKTGEMKAKNTLSPKFLTSTLQWHASWAATHPPDGSGGPPHSPAPGATEVASQQQSCLLTTELWRRRDITSQRLPSPWVSAFASFSLSLIPSLSAGLKGDGPAEAALAAWKKFRADRQIPFSTVHAPTGLGFCFLHSYCVYIIVLQYSPSWEEKAQTGRQIKAMGRAGILLCKFMFLTMPVAGNFSI